MKTLTTLILTLSLVIPSTMAQARENGMDGFILGAGGGALIGQAIGRNTEATLIGTAVGSMLGYIVGNERDKSGIQNRVTYQTTRRQYPQTRYVEVVPRRHTQPEPICRETEMLAEIDGQAEKVYGTACLENGEWVINNPAQVSQTVIIEKNKRRHSKRNANYRRAKHWRNNRYDRPVIYRQIW